MYVPQYVIIQGIDMARSGINKSEVFNARAALISKGKNPSIDAIRIELGNTGSKSTIHRYLQEIEQENAAQLDDEALLSKPIKELITKLTSTLKQEAQSGIDESELAYKRQTDCLRNELSASNKQLLETKEKLVYTTENLNKIEASLQSSQNQERMLVEELAVIKQENDKLKIQIGEKLSQIESLETKHQHNRDAMEHYRTSVKEQREQEQRRYETQIQQLQTEIRTLGQTISVKQNDITILNKDNGRLCAELSSEQKSKTQLESTLRAKQAELTSLNSQNMTLSKQMQNIENERAKFKKSSSDFKEIKALNESSNQKVLKLKTELSVKNDIISSLMKQLRLVKDPLQSSQNNV